MTQELKNELDELALWLHNNPNHPEGAEKYRRYNELSKLSASCANTKKWFEIHTLKGENV